MALKELQDALNSGRRGGVRDHALTWLKPRAQLRDSPSQAQPVVCLAVPAQATRPGGFPKQTCKPVQGSQLVAVRHMDRSCSFPSAREGCTALWMLQHRAQGCRCTRRCRVPCARQVSVCARDLSLRAAPSRATLQDARCGPYNQELHTSSLRSSAGTQGSTSLIAS